MMDISICIITKNERDHLKRCLSCLKPLGFEIVVVDTGSTDDSIEIARRYTDSVYEFEWVDDFSIAKNYAICKAKNDMVMVVDSDEYYLDGEIETLLTRIEKNKDYVGRFYRRERYQSENGGWEESIVGVDRIFDRIKYHYAGRIHEQIVSGSVFDENRVDTREALNNQSPILVYDTELVFEHDGYTGSAEEQKKKAQRNAELLIEELKKWPDDTYLLYQLAKCYQVSEDTEKAISVLDDALSEEVNPELDWVVDMVVCYGYALLKLELYEQALSLEGVFDEFKTHVDYVFMMGLIYLNNALFDQALKMLLLCTSMKEERAVGVGSYKAWYNAGVIEECMGHIDKAIEYYRNAGDYEPAKNGLLRIM